MALFPKDICVALKTTLENSSRLSYVDSVVIQKYRRESIPDFDNYCIIISPSSAQAVVYPASQRFIQLSIDLILLGVVNYTLEDAIIGDSPNENPPRVGILTMYEDIFYTLYQNNLGGVIELAPGYTELDSLAAFDVIVDSRLEPFVVEARVVYSPRGKRFISLS